MIAALWINIATILVYIAANTVLFSRWSTEQTKRVTDLEAQLENEKVLRSRLEHRIGVLEAQWENRDT